MDCAYDSPPPAEWGDGDFAEVRSGRARNARRRPKASEAPEGALGVSEVMIECADNFHLFSCAMGMLVALCNLSLLEEGAWALTQIKTGPLLLLFPLSLAYRWLVPEIPRARPRPSLPAGGRGGAD